MKTSLSIPAIEIDNNSIQSIPFLDKTIDCAIIDGVPYVVVSSMIEAIGLAYNSAKELISNDEILSQVTSIWRYPSPKYQGQSVLCLPLKFVPGWLFSINIKKVSPEVKVNLLAYRRDVYDVLFNHYFGEATKVSTGMKRKLEIDLKIKANNQEIKRLTSLNEGIKALKEENAILTKEKKSLDSKISGQLGFNFELLD